MKTATDFLATMKFTEADGVTPKSLAGYTAIKFMIKNSELDPDSSALLSKNAISTVSNQPLGIAIANVTALENTLPPNRLLVAEGMAVLASGQVIRTLTATITFEHNVIKATS